MSVNEFQRHQVFQWFEEAMGPERAAIMMDLLPPVGWGDIVTKTDLHALRAELRGEMADLRAHMSELGGELRGEMASLSRDVNVAIERSKSEIVRTLFFGMVASNAALGGLVFAAVRL